MTRKCTALLRAVNVGGRGLIAMSDLCDLCTELGLRNVRSLLNSGNLVFDPGTKKIASLGRLLETETKKRFGLASDIFVRTAAQWKDVINGNPFTPEARTDPGHLVVMLTRDTINAGSVRELQKTITGPEQVRTGGSHLYITYPLGIGKSKLTIVRIESALGTRGTGRNWNTVLRIDRTLDT